MLSIFDLSQRRVLVTGGYGHIGREICYGLLDAGAEVVVAGRSLEKFRHCFAADTAKFSFINVDLADRASIKNSITEVGEQQLDVIINNAFFVKPTVSGGKKFINGRKIAQNNYIDGLPTGFSASDLDCWDSGIDGTLSSAFFCCQAALPYLRCSDQPRIINIASMYGIVAPNPAIYKNCRQQTNQVAYGVAKAGVLQLTRYLASFLGAEGICVNSLSPGPFPSNLPKGNFAKKLAANVALSRLGRPQELRGAVIFLASRASSFVTGHNLVVDGGWTIR